MKVWLLTVGEPLPIDPGSPRLLRGGILAEVLASRGHKVTWWTSNFRHTEKTKRFPQSTTVDVDDSLRICCLDSRPYRRNVSLARILAHRDMAAEFRRLTSRESPPDIVFASYPTPELAMAGAQFAAVHAIPAVVDIRDLWPDAWSTMLPRALRPIARLPLWLFHQQSRRTLKRFESIYAITDGMVEWGIRRAGRTRRASDKVFPLAYSNHEYPQSKLDDARRFWSTHLDHLSPGHLQLCFFGNISDRARVDVAIDAVRLLPAEQRSQIRLVLCGTGEALAGVRRQAIDLPQIVLPGWVSGPQINILASLSHAGILPYPSDPDFVRSIPNKAIEYLAHNLPILASLKGPVQELITHTKCGRTYDETNPQDLARVIAELLHDPSQLEGMATNANRVFQERFLASTVYGELADSLAELAIADR